MCFSIYDVHKAFQTNDALIDLFLDEEFSEANYKKVRARPGKCRARPKGLYPPALPSITSFM